MEKELYQLLLPLVNRYTEDYRHGRLSASNITDILVANLMDYLVPRGNYYHKLESELSSLSEDFVRHDKILTSLLTSYKGFLAQAKLMGIDK